MSIYLQEEQRFEIMSGGRGLVLIKAIYLRSCDGVKSKSKLASVTIAQSRKETVRTLGGLSSCAADNRLKLVALSLYYFLKDYSCIDMLLSCRSQEKSVNFI